VVAGSLKNRSGGQHARGIRGRFRSGTRVPSAIRERAARSRLRPSGDRPSGDRGRRLPHRSAAGGGTGAGARSRGPTRGGGGTGRGAARAVSFRLGVPVKRAGGRRPEPPVSCASSRALVRGTPLADYSITTFFSVVRLPAESRAKYTPRPIRAPSSERPSHWAAKAPEAAS